MKEAPKPTGRVLVDFDNTICVSRFVKGKWTMEEPIAGMREAMLKIGETRDLIVFTARPKKEWKKIRRWMVANQMPFDKVSNRKKPADLYVDDKALYPQDFVAQYNPDSLLDTSGVFENDYLGEND